MGKITRAIKFVLLAGFALLLTNCVTEESGIQKVNQSSNEAKIWFDANKSTFDSSILEYMKELQWENAIVSSGEFGEVIEIPFTLRNVSTSNENGSLYNDHHRLMFIKDGDSMNNYKAYHVQLFSSASNSKILDEKYNFYNIQDNFSGKIFVQDLIANKINAVEFKHGQIIQPSATSKCREETYDCTFFGYWDEGGSFHPIKLLYCDGGGGFVDGEPYPQYGGGGGGNTTPSQNICPDGYVKKMNQCILDQKIFDQLTGKAKCIYERLMESALFGDAIKKIDGDFAVSHLKLTINNNLDPTVYAITMSPVNYVTEIQFDNSQLATLSDLGNAVVFAHEVIHAEIFRKMLSAAQNGSLDPATMTSQQQVAYVTSLKNNYPGLMDYYYNRNHPTWNHNMMASHYRGTIADVIQQFDSNRLPRATYESVSWLGLGKLGDGLSTVAWNNLSAAEQTAITNLINENLYKGPSTCTN